jgi:hypothetical protein
VVPKLVVSCYRRLARVGLPANHTNITNAKTMTSEMLAREGFTQRRQVRKGGLAQDGLPANHTNITNAKTMTSEMLAREGFTQRRQVRKGGLAQDGFNTKTEGNEV